MEVEDNSSSRDDVLLEAVPNMSVTDASDVSAVRRACADAGAVVLDSHVDVDHGRSVFTIVGTVQQLSDSLRAASVVALQRVDLRGHGGVHPRTGIVDVVPIVPLDELGVEQGGSLADAQKVVAQLAPALGDLGVPVLAYGLGTTAPRTATLRPAHGAMRQVAAALEGGEYVPIAGPNVMDPSRGVVMLGVRNVLIAFNVELLTRDLSVARHISGVIRELGGGLSGVRSLAFPLPSRGTVQVSCNIERWTEAGPAEVLERVADLAAMLGVDIVRAELVGLAPAEALHDLRIACRRNHVRLSACTEPALELRVQMVRSRIAHP